MRALLHRLDGTIEKLPISPRFFRFCVVGGSGVVVNLAVLRLMMFLLPAGWGNWQHRTAMAWAIVVSIFTNFLLNDLWTWGDREKGGARQWLQRLAKFYVVSAAAAVVQWGAALLLYERDALAFITDAIFRLYTAQAIAIVLAMGINFTMNHLWTFRRKRTG